jgi:hypothetical protein
VVTPENLLLLPPASLPPPSWTSRDSWKLRLQEHIATEDYGIPGHSSGTTCSISSLIIFLKTTCLLKK